jgi:hypothetical protein
VVELTGLNLLNALTTARWDVAFRTYGNAHATLIGLLVDWWVSGDLQRRWVLEGGPTNGYGEPGIRGQCDALLGLDGEPVGVVEVEGTRYALTARKIGTFFEGSSPELAPIRFGLLLLYAYDAVGSGAQREFPSPAVPEALAEVRRVTKRHPTKPLLIITLDKTYRRIHAGLRARNEYYKGEPSRIQGLLYENGQERARLVLKIT